MCPVNKNNSDSGETDGKENCRKDGRRTDHASPVSQRVDPKVVIEQTEGALVEAETIKIEQEDLEETDREAKIGSSQR